MKVVVENRGCNILIYLTTPITAGGGIVFISTSFYFLQVSPYLIFIFKVHIVNNPNFKTMQFFYIEGE